MELLKNDANIIYLNWAEDENTYVEKRIPDDLQIFIFGVKQFRRESYAFAPEYQY
ncbi:hypothetical protein ACFP1I_02115 [Dyadobacter subterraneus]|uniref:Uncharacterized protein n=1 Tax=Dyadobacter subterraneus TaxID=2773304 RepID=A0ABR9W7V1_9BACT|nr:hypothetical protein [Dyadobacter subterraneus]MBE9461547.1 hypothetical protein [Dyadobacter subterraneus]